jgi:hypothetical protein
MARKSKGDYLSFCDDVSKSQDPEVIHAYLTVYCNKDTQPEQFLQWFKDKAYHGVSLEDCEKLLFVRDHVGLRDAQGNYKLPWDFEAKKY